MTAKANTGQNPGHFGAAYSLECTEDTLAHYKSWARTYDREVGEENGYAQPGRTAEMLQRYCKDPKAVILDAGCGSGLSGLALKMAGYQSLHGCDFSPEMLRIAQNKECYDRVFEADLNEGMPQIPNGTYDAVVCVGVFSFGHVMPEACDELLRVLATGGTLVIALNEQFWERGDLRAKIDDLIDDGTVEQLACEYGDHLPGHNVMGWVIALRKRDP